MFDLQKEINDWCTQMRASGVNSPVPLAELENHLRDDVERQIQSGVGVEKAFEVASIRIGQGYALKKEFSKNAGFWTANHVLGVLWGAGCLVSFYTLCQSPIPDPFAGRDKSKLLMWAPLLFNMNAYFLYVGGVAGSVLLFRGAKWGRKIVRMLALLMAVACVAQLFDVKWSAAWRVWCAVVMVFSVGSIWLLHRPEKMAPMH